MSACHGFLLAAEATQPFCKASAASAASAASPSSLSCLSLDFAAAAKVAETPGQRWMYKVSPAGYWRAQATIEFVDPKDGSFWSGRLMSKFSASGQRLWKTDRYAESCDGCPFVFKQSFGDENSGAIYVLGAAGPYKGSNGEKLWLTKFSASGTMVWSKGFDSKGGGDYRKRRVTPHAAVLDPSGDVIMVGVCQSECFGKNFAWNAKKKAHAFVAKVTSSGEVAWVSLIPLDTGRHPSDGFVRLLMDKSGNALWVSESTWMVKVSSDGSRKWTQFIEHPHRRLVRSAELDAGGKNVWLSVMSLGNHPFMGMHRSNSQHYFADAVALKLDWETGKFVSKTLISSSDSDEARGATSDRSGNFLVAGDTYGALAPGGRKSTGRQTDVFVRKMDGNLRTLWTKQWGPSCFMRTMLLDGNDDVVVAGSCSGSAFGHTNHGNLDVYVVKLSKDDGKMLWSYWYGTSALDRPAGMKTDRDGNVIVAGYSKPHGFTWWVLKLGPTGEKLWLKEYPSLTPLTNWNGVGTLMRLDENSNAYYVVGQDFPKFNVAHMYMFGGDGGPTSGSAALHWGKKVASLRGDLEGTQVDDDNTLDTFDSKILKPLGRWSIWATSLPKPGLKERALLTKTSSSGGPGSARSAAFITKGQDVGLPAVALEKVMSYEGAGSSDNASIALHPGCKDSEKKYLELEFECHAKSVLLVGYLRQMGSHCGDGIDIHIFQGSNQVASSLAFNTDSPFLLPKKGLKLQRGDKASVLVGPGSSGSCACDHASLSLIAKDESAEEG